jgi:hypothetical protein
MARPQVADGEGLQIWRVAANILNKQSRQPTRGGPSAWGLGVGLTTPHRKNIMCYEMFQSASYLDVKMDLREREIDVAY